MTTQFHVWPRTVFTAFSVMWVVNAPWAHPVWHLYVIILVDLITFLPDHPKPKLYKPGVTHEVTVYAWDPEHKIPKPIDWGGFAVKLMQPPNHCYQFTAESDEAAMARIQNLIPQIERRLLSPDTDYRHQWDQIFHDGVTLRKG